MMNTIRFDSSLLPGGHLYCPAEFAKQPQARFQVTVTFETPDPDASNSLVELNSPHQAGALLLRYLMAELSLGELAQQLNLTYPETRDWLNRLGIPSLRKVSPALEQFTQDNMLKFLQQRGIQRIQ